MGSGRGPTEEYDGRITVRIFQSEGGSRAELCSSYEEAIEVVKENQYSAEETRIVDPEGQIMYSSIDTDIEAWESIWRQQKLRQGVDVEEHDCPYDNASCFADDLCVQCKMDKVQEDERQLD